MSDVLTGTPSNCAAQLAATITGLANNGSGAVRVTTAAPHLFGNGDCVRVVTTPTTGEFVIAVIDAQDFDLVGSTFTATGTGTATDMSLTPQILVPTDGDTFSLQLSGMLSALQGILDRTQNLELRSGFLGLVGYGASTWGLYAGIGVEGVGYGGTPLGTGAVKQAGVVGVGGAGDNRGVHGQGAGHGVGIFGVGGPTAAAGTGSFYSVGGYFTGGTGGAYGVWAGGTLGYAGVYATSDTGTALSAVASGFLPAITGDCSSGTGQGALFAGGVGATGAECDGGNSTGTSSAGHGVTGFGGNATGTGSCGAGGYLSGGSTTNGTGGRGCQAVGGTSNTGNGGDGITASGGNSTNAFAGNGITAYGAVGNGNSTPGVYCQPGITGKPALVAHNGPIQTDAQCAPTTTPIVDALYTSNIPKAIVAISCTNAKGNVVAFDSGAGFNEGGSCAYNNVTGVLTFTLAYGFPGGAIAIPSICMTASGIGQCYATISGSTVTVYVFDATGAGYNGGGNGAFKLSVVIFGHQ